MKNQNEELHNIVVSGFAYELIREELISDLLGKETDKILYFAGKNIARNHPLQSIEEIMDFFIMAGWGNLHIVKEKKNEIQFSLTGELISHRFQQQKECTYQLECGFLSQQIQQQKGTIAEAYEDYSKRKEKIDILVKWDLNDFI
ncbi:MAG: YslB family protein [Bacillaceae bacterium]